MAGSDQGSQEGISCPSLSCSVQNASARKRLLLVPQLTTAGAPSNGSVLGAVKSCTVPPAARQAAALLLCTNQPLECINLHWSRQVG